MPEIVGLAETIRKNIGTLQISADEAEKVIDELFAHMTDEDKAKLKRIELWQH